MTGTLAVDVEGERGAVRGYGALVVLDLPSVAAARAFARSVQMAARGPGEQLARTLRRADLTVDVRVRGVSVARVGGSTGGPLARALSSRLGVESSLSLGGLIRSLLR